MVATRLSKNEVLRVDDARDMEVCVDRGTLWITQERDARDVMLSAGQRFKLDRNGVTLMSACGRIAQIRLSYA